MRILPEKSIKKPGVSQAYFLITCDFINEIFSAQSVNSMVSA